MSPTAAFSHSHWGLQLLSRSLYTMLRKPLCPASQWSRVLTSALPPTCYVTLNKAHPLCGPNFEVSKKEGLPRMLSEACAHLVILTVPHRWVNRARTGGHIRLEIWKGMARGRNATKQKYWKRERNSGWVSVLFEGKYITINMQRFMQSTVQVTVTWPPFLYAIPDISSAGPRCATACFGYGLHVSGRPQGLGLPVQARMRNLPLIYPLITSCSCRAIPQMIFA